MIFYLDLECLNLPQNPSPEWSENPALFSADCNGKLEIAPKKKIEKNITSFGYAQSYRWYDFEIR